MKYKIFAFLTLSIFVLNLGGSTFADSKTRANALVSMLPASDGVATVDVKRFFGDAMPKLLSDNQPMLGKINAKIDESRAKTGIDVRQFDQVAIGIAIRQLGAKNYDVDPVVIARGQATSASIINAAKTAPDAKYREERFGDRTIYIFAGKKVTAPAGAPAPAADAMKSLDEIAVAAIDDRTIAFGEIGRVRQTLEARTKVSAELASLLVQNPTAVTSFAAKLPTGLKAFLPLENDELGKNIDSIQLVYGNADVVGDIASLHVTARTLQNTQAKSLHETLLGLQMLGKAFLGGAKGSDKEVFARMIENVKFSLKANEVSIDLQVPQGDIDILVGRLK